MRRTSTCITIVSIALIGIISCNNPSTRLASNNSVEDSIRTMLKIPSDAKRVIILSPNAHMDWDWLNAFPYNSDLGTQITNCQPCLVPSYVAPCSYFNGTTQPANTILTDATQKLVDSSSFYYSVCEMGFLRAFAKKNPALFSQMKKTNHMNVVGGGITSPDNLLPNGETFFRNFLVAKQWLDSESTPWSQQVWLPDDFGHDPQLPVMLQALDAMGVGFARIPGACDGGPQSFTTPPKLLLDTVNGGVDFLWTAADGSETIAHWLQDHYGQGNNIDSQGEVFNSVNDNLTCNQSFYASTSNEHIQSYIDTNGPVSPTPYIFVDVSGDFMIPHQQLLADANAWNSDPSGYGATGVYAVVATFDHYVRLINNYSSKLKTRSYEASSPESLFQPNPYWMGYYASRPELKTLHQRATRTLLAAESFQVLANTLVPSSQSNKQSQLTNLLNAWDSLAPSTHHDYITGTSVDDVYKYEQLRLLNAADSLGSDLKSEFMNQVANGISASESSVAVFNSLGFDNQGVIEYEPAGSSNIFLNVVAPSLGYQVNNLADAQKGDNSLKAGKVSSGNYYLSNTLLSSSFDSNSGDLIALTDLSTNENILSGAGNEIVLFNDHQGDIYRFGYESGSMFSKVSLNWNNVQIAMDTLNELQKSISVTKSTTIGGSQKTFSIIYSLRQGESYLRISTTGSLPSYYTAMVKFPLKNTVDNIMAGTPYHWNSMTPMDYGTNGDFNATMWATHDFVIPRSNGSALAAIYHGSTPAWASDGNNLYGVILRNTPSTGYGACGSDDGVHTQEYALRIPSGLGMPDTGQPLKEARQYNTPMVAVAISATSGGTLPASYSMASTNGNAIITTTKWSYSDPNALILRVYQPTNTNVVSTLKFGSNQLNCRVVSALEVPIKSANTKASCTGSGSQYQLTLPRAVATFKFE